MTPEQIQDKANHVFMYDGYVHHYDDVEVTDKQRDAFTEGAVWVQEEFEKQLTAKDAAILRTHDEMLKWFKECEKLRDENATLRGELEKEKTEHQWAAMKWAECDLKRSSLQSELDAAKERVMELEKYEAWVNGGRAGVL